MPPHDKKNENTSVCLGGFVEPRNGAWATLVAKVKKNQKAKTG